MPMFVYACEFSRSDDTHTDGFTVCWRGRAPVSVSALADSLVSHQALLQLEAGGLESMQGGGIDSAI